MLAGLLTGAPGQGRGGMGGGDQITQSGARQMQEALRAVHGLAAGACQAARFRTTPTSGISGRDTTKQGAALLLLFDQHVQHLGQSIAYARSNSVVPPWSK